MGRWYLGQLASGATLDWRMRRFSICKCPAMPTAQAADWWFSDIRGWSITHDSSRPLAAVSPIWNWMMGWGNPRWIRCARACSAPCVFTTLMELRSLYEHFQARILELIEAYLGASAI